MYGNDLAVWQAYSLASIDNYTVAVCKLGDWATAECGGVARIPRLAWMHKGSISIGRMTSCSRHGFGRCIADVFRDLGGRDLRRKTLDRGPQISHVRAWSRRPLCLAIAWLPWWVYLIDVSFEADACEAKPPIADLKWSRCPNLWSHVRLTLVNLEQYLFNLI